MKAIYINKYGSSDQLEYSDNFPKPRIKNNQVLVNVKASGINPVDYKIRQGDFRLLFRQKFPFIPGTDLSGIVMEEGKGVSKFKKGDEVYGFLPPKEGGANAEFAAVDEKYLALKPPKLSFEEAASIPMAALTAQQALLGKARIKPGNIVLINGASGGVGSFAVQIAKAHGALVSGLCSGENMNLVRSLGIDEVFDYNEIHISELEEEYDIIFDAVSKASFNDIRNILHKEGVFISTLPSPANILKSLNLSLKKLVGNKQRCTTVMVKSSGEELDQISDLVNEEKLFPMIEKIYPYNEIRQAHEHSQSGRVKGKIVIKIG